MAIPNGFALARGISGSPARNTSKSLIYENLDNRAALRLTGDAMDVSDKRIGNDLITSPTVSLLIPGVNGEEA